MDCEFNHYNYEINRPILSWSIIQIPHDIVSSGDVP
jgi:hypothetical protein